MSITINNIVLHQLTASTEGSYQMALRQSLLAINPTVENMMSDVLRLFSTKNKTYGMFMPASEFMGKLSALIASDIDFLSFSHQVMQNIIDRAVEYPFIESGVTLFCEYQYLAKKFLLIALFSSRESALVNEQLEISTTHYLNIEQADMVAVLDITQWQTEPESVRYLSCLNGRIGRRVADFFLDLFGAQEGLKIKEQNKNLLKAVEEYCKEEQLDTQQKQECRQQVYSYCQFQLKAGEEISVNQLASSLPDYQQKKFDQFIAEKAYPIEDVFPADRSTLRQLAKYSGSGGGLSVSFDATLLGERVEWDAINDTLIIKGLPSSLRQQLLNQKPEKEDQ